MDFLCGDERFEVGKVEFPRSSSTETLLPLGTYLCFLGNECRIRGCSREVIKLVRKLDVVHIPLAPRLRLYVPVNGGKIPYPSLANNLERLASSEHKVVYSVSLNVNYSSSEHSFRILATRIDA
jgi:hypothetical protein